MNWDETESYFRRARLTLPDGEQDVLLFSKSAEGGGAQQRKFLRAWNVGGTTVEIVGHAEMSVQATVAVRFTEALGSGFGPDEDLDFVCDAEGYVYGGDVTNDPTLTLEAHL